MDGMHDLGGRQGFGKIEYPARPYRETWEPALRAIWLLGVRNGTYNMDEYRHAIERMDPVQYLSAPYYERTLTAVATLLVEKGVVTSQELEARAGGAFPLSRPISPGRQNTPTQAFAIGDAVRVKNEFTSGHTRMPGYIRGKAGTVVGIAPPTPFPDAAGHGMKAAAEPVYDVRFRSRDLWPDSSDDALVHACMFQSYLEKAGE
jgi:nitrile hydratase beta subunit